MKPRSWHVSAVGISGCGKSSSPSLTNSATKIMLLYAQSYDSYRETTAHQVSLSSESELRIGRGRESQQGREGMLRSIILYNAHNGLHTTQSR
jgi:hypothetical protein